MSHGFGHYEIVNPYCSALTFIKTAKEMAHAESKFNLRGDVRAKHAFAFEIWHETDHWHWVFMYLSPVARQKKQAIHNLAHECGHMALMIAAHNNFKAEDGRGEPFCHLLDWLVRQGQTFYGIRAA